MSRIHEALQKAVEGSAGTAATAATTEEPTTDAVDVFPVELSERRRQRTSRPAEPPAAPSLSPEPSTAASPDSEQRLGFERLAAGYAGKVVIDEAIAPASREQYRRLAASLHHAQEASGIKVVMLTSAVMGEGKTLTCSNLALTLSESYQKNVLLIDADLRRPALQALFRLSPGPGLSDGLVEVVERKVPVHQVSSRLGILAAGRPTSDPIAGLTSLRMKRLLDEARGSFDWVIVDTPPVALLTDANLLSAMVDGAVIVVRAGATPWELVRRAVAAVGPDRLLGVVLNGATAESHNDYYGYGYGYYTAPPSGNFSS